MIYRDQMEQCPRCGVDLIDANAARSCSQCNGLWIGIADVQEMVQQMRTPPEPMDLPFAWDSRQPLPCPGCSEPMRALKLYNVEIDTCEKHGIWFDPKELGLVLLRSVYQPKI